MKLVIIFSGLVAHILSGNNWRAVVIQTPLGHPHRGEMRVHEDDVRGSIVGFKSRKVGDYHVIELEQALTISNLPAGPPTESPEFDEYVPSLKDAMVSIDNDAMVGNVSHDGVQASLLLGGGDIAPKDCIYPRAVWTSGAAPMPECLAREVRYEVTPTAGTVTISGGGASITIEPRHPITISNNEVGNHFFLYRLLGTSSSIRVPNRHPIQVCTSCNRVLSFTRAEVQRAFPDLDCSNSQYP